MKSKVFELQNNEREKFSTKSKTLDFLTSTQKTPTVPALGYCHKQHNGNVRKGEPKITEERLLVKKVESIGRMGMADGN